MIESLQRLGTLALAAAIAGVAPSVSAQTAVMLRPNLVPLVASNLSLVSNASGRITLRFATTSWNNGSGPLELLPGPVDTGSGKQMVYQRIRTSDGGSVLNQAGSFTYHADHDHIHFDDYALYTLQPVNAPGGSERTGVKTTFCVMDTTKVNTTLAGAPAQAVFTTCNKDLQGMSIGWGDTYGAHLAGQEIDFTDNADGIYQLKIEIDPRKLIIEGSDNDNVSCVLLSIRKPSTVTVLDSSGNCSAVVSISPNTAAMGATVQVTISGYGFRPGMAVSFEGGNGPRPEASNVQLSSDTDTLDLITATITVPPKRKGGKDPVWNLRVEGGVLNNAFTVTP